MDRSGPVSELETSIAHFILLFKKCQYSLMLAKVILSRS